MRHLPLLLPAVACLTPFSQAIATEALALSAVEVTATRTAQSVDETLAPVTILSREQIVASQAADLIQLLDGTPGVVMSRNGGLGTTMNLMLRGTGSSQVLVLVDGVRIGSASLGTASLQHIALDQVDHIEIVRGPRSQLYGADAVGGIIQIFTLRGEGPPRLNATVEGGSYQTQGVSAGVSGSSGANRYALSASRRSSDGFSALRDNHPDDDGYRNSALSLNLQRSLSRDLDAGVTLLRTEADGDYDSQWDSVGDYATTILQQTAQAAVKWRVDAAWEMRITLGESRDESDELLDGVVSDHFTTRRSQLNWQNDWLLANDDLLTAGVDLLRDGVGGSTAYATNERDNRGYFVQLQHETEEDSLIIGLRHDSNSSYAGANTGSVTWGRALGADLRFTGAVATAFRAPTFNDLFYPGSGNATLRPESSQTTEFSLVGSPEWGGWELRAYHTDVQDLIAWVEVDPEIYFWQPQNVNRARLDGIEASFRLSGGRWQTAAVVNILETRDLDSDQQLIQRPRATMKLDLGYRLGAKTVLQTIVHGRSSSYSDVANRDRVAGYATVDLQLRYPLAPSWTVQAKAENVLDRDYESIRGYNSAGRSFYLSLHYQQQ
ncbi:MAG: TonB-dependent receptor [Gammaproteobacteria bacterium]|nr:TonB-dependent receptor [Gammaproteobacteria bacterium]